MGYYGLRPDSLIVASKPALSSGERSSSCGQWLRARFAKDATSIKDDAVFSKAALDDMVEQGAKELWQLGFVELAFATGRTPARRETEGFAYRAPWSSMVGRLA